MNIVITEAVNSLRDASESWSQEATRCKTWVDPPEFQRPRRQFYNVIYLAAAHDALNLSIAADFLEQGFYYNCIKISASLSSACAKSIPDHVWNFIRVLAIDEQKNNEKR